MKKAATALSALCLALASVAAVPIQQQISEKYEAYSELADTIYEYDAEEIAYRAESAAERVESAIVSAQLRLWELQDAFDGAKEKALAEISKIASVGTGSPDDYGLDGELSSAVEEMRRLVEEVRLKKSEIEALASQLSSLTSKAQSVNSGSDAPDEWATREWISDTFAASWEVYQLWWLAHHTGSFDDLGERVCDEDCSCRQDHEFDYTPAKNLYERVKWLVNINADNPPIGSIPA